MNRTAILPNTTMQTQKKTVECDKLSENFLCDEIHSNFRVLASVHPFGDDFRTVFEKGMFIKSNPKAFPHVMKYLFTICDALEFKKKFCWPIYNKAAEATFRNSTLDLLNKLNAQYGLGFGEIKFKILIFPGGVEFMRVIFELTRLSMQLILKRNGITNPESSTAMSLVSVQKHLDDLEEICTFVMDFKKQVQEWSTKIKTKTEVLHKLLENVIASTSITSENILRDKFADRWEELHSDILERGIEPDLARLMQFQDNCQKLEEKISAIFKHHSLKIDENALTAFSMEIRKVLPQEQQHQHQHVSNIVDSGGRINLDNLLQAFRLALPLMQQSIQCYKPRSVKAMAYESNQLEKLSKKSNDLLQRIQQISGKSIVAEQSPEKVVQAHSIAPAMEQIQSMILTTPTISHDVIRRAECAAIQSTRLSLLEDAYQSRPTMSAHNVRPLNSILEESRNNGQCDQKLFASPSRLFNNNKESKCKLDPLAMLSTITKKVKMEKHVASSAFRPRAMNFGLQAGIGGGNGLLECSRTNDTILSVPDFSSTLLNQSTSHDQSKNDQKIRSFMNNSDRDLNCSPSGRIEPLVTAKLQCSGVKPIKELDEMDWNEQVTSPYETPIQRKLTDVSALSKHVTRDLSNIENNQNASNRGAFNLINMIDDNDESLLNMSDQILNDLVLDDSDSR